MNTMTRSTHTYVVLEVSDVTYTEISDKLRAAGYTHAFHEDENQIVIDMHGIAVARESIAPTSKESARLIYQTHVNACRVCRAPASSLCDEGKRLHMEWVGL